ncbi:hypothetical protein VNO77_27748 [Canavalia gladiata]|uniref:Uncharacterized protein n=1 Tax=Canavalia gladiata TaxID=3824 RepID=A0AAN9KUP6_CANGL
MLFRKLLLTLALGGCILSYLCTSPSLEPEPQEDTPKSDPMADLLEDTVLARSKPNHEPTPHARYTRPFMRKNHAGRSNLWLGSCEQVGGLIELNPSRTQSVLQDVHSVTLFLGSANDHKFVYIVWGPA